MPPIFKALASITAWGLFIWGAITLISVTLAYFIQVGWLNPPDLSIQIGWIISTVQLVLAVVVMKLRQMLE